MRTLQTLSKSLRMKKLKIGDKKVRIHYKLFDIDDMGTIGFSTRGVGDLSSIKLTKILSSVLYSKQKKRFFTEDELKVIFHQRLDYLGVILTFITKESGLVGDSGESFP